jgi:two-component system chemotaxis response regulator CheY
MSYHEQNSRGRCLIADDSRIVRRVAVRILRDLGFEVMEAATGTEALDQCRLSMPDCVFVDWDMRGRSGLDVLHAVRELPGGDGVKIIFCTAERTPEKIMQALSAGADEYIMKPFDSDIVESKLMLTGLLPARGMVAGAA